MKALGVTVGSAILGSAITLGVVALSGWDSMDSPRKAERPTVKIEHVEAPIAHGTLLTKDESGNVVPLDFRATAGAAMDAVVHIKSTKMYQGSSEIRPNSLPDPFEHFFQGSPFGDLFQSPFRFEYRTPQNRGPKVNVGTGSGVIINDNGYIITNNHVIDNASDIEVTLHDKRSYKATVVGTDPSTDLALLQIEASGLPTIPLVNSDDVEVGQWVLAVGNPFNLNSTVTAGIISAKGRNINILKDKGAIESFIQTDAAINPGNSGGALVDLNGGLVGVNTAIASPTGSYSGYGFAVPSNIVNKVVEDLLQYGVVQRGYLGIMIKNVDGKLAQENDLAVSQGVYVDSLFAQSAADKAGVKKGDVILQVDGIQVNTSPELQELIGRKRPGDEVELKINRSGKEKMITVVLYNNQGKTDLVEKGRQQVLEVLGAEFETLDNKAAKRLGIDGGVKVTKLHSGKLRQSTGVKEGFIITKVGQTPVHTVEQLGAHLEDKKGGVMLEGLYEDIPGKYYYAFGL